MPVSIFCTHSTFTHCFFHQRLVTDTLKNFSYLGVPFGRSRLRIQHCHCNSSCRCGGMDLIPGPGTSACHGCGQKKGKKKNQLPEQANHSLLWAVDILFFLKTFPSSNLGLNVTFTQSLLWLTVKPGYLIITSWCSLYPNLYVYNTTICNKTFLTLIFTLDCKLQKHIIYFLDDVPFSVLCSHVQQILVEWMGYSLIHWSERKPKCRETQRCNSTSSFCFPRIPLKWK